MEKSHGTQYDLYWHGQPGQSGVPKVPGLFTHIRDLDNKRNQIVHWHLVREVSAAHSEEVLKRPAFWYEKGSAEKITKDDLISFVAKANFIVKSINKFYLIIYAAPRIPALPESDRTPWLNIFQQPVPYPPPETHPLFSRST
jgi:hypothetical protein